MYRTSMTEAVVGDLRFQLACLESFESAVDLLYEALESSGDGAQLETLCPYFGVLWPGARVLARWMWEQGRAAFENRRVLELGCGLALPSLVAARLGAEVIATDAHPHVPAFLARNLALNPESRVHYRALDWREGAARDLERFDWIVGSDILYEKDQASSLVRFLRRELATGGEAVVLDPNRSFWESMVATARDEGLEVFVEALPARCADEPESSLLLRARVPKMA